tara:strand:+ start:2805 stop:3308 length:504 start_codon:yes stop_codon:yes gene_type:complete
MDKNFKINDGQEHRVVINCPLCGDKELHLVQDDLNSMQCLSCGYSTNDTYTGDPEKCEPFLNLDEDLRKWAEESQGQMWIPSVLRLPIGLYYPIDKDDKMKWALAPLVSIPEDEQKNYPVEGQEDKFHTKKYDVENELYFNNFGKGLKQVNSILDKQKDLLDDVKKS